MPTPPTRNRYVAFGFIRIDGGWDGVKEEPIWRWSLTKNIVVFNAPMGVGKDAIVDHLVDLFRRSSKKMEMKARLIALTCLIYGVSKEWWEENYTRIGKEQPREELGGLSMRNALIHTSEVVIKPNYGQDYFGKAARQELDAIGKTWFFFADGGFPAELIPIGEGYKPLLIRIHRDGYEYDPLTDSRSYVKDEDLSDNWVVMDINNVEGKFDEFVSDVMDALNTHFA